MAELTKQWLQQKIADMEATRDDIPFGLDEDDSNTLAALRYALASLEADDSSEPVAFINGAWALVYYRPPKELGLKIGDKLYTAPPAPVALPSGYSDFEEIWSSSTHPLTQDDEMKDFAWDIWNACRAAMLQGADDNSPVVLDGWVMVPVEPTHEMLEAGDEQFGTYDVYRRMLAAAPKQELKK